MDQTNLFFRTIMDTLKKDIRFGIRSFVKRPGFTAISILTLALGIGASTAIFSVVDGVLLRPLPYPHAEQIVQLREVNTKGTKVAFTRSGWFLVRAIADEKRTFRFASTAPFWVEVEGAERRVSKAAAEFFVRWVDERIERVRSALKAEEELASVLAHHERAREFWRGLRDRANAE